MDETEEGEDYLGSYGVVIVPPDEQAGSWLVTLSEWDDEKEQYVASTDGPVLESEEEAMAEAFKVLRWLRTQSRDDDLGRVWQQMQDQVGREEGLGEPWPQRRRPWDF